MLRVHWDNHTEILFLGSNKIKFKLSNESSSTLKELHVPFSVINEILDNLILGFNVIKLLVNNTSNKNTLINSLRSKVKNVKSNNIKTLINLISQSTDHDEFLVHSMASTTILPANRPFNRGN